MNDIINDLTLGEVITINGSSHVVLQKLANVKIGDLATEMEGIINNLTLKEVLGESTVNGNAVLKLIANEPISGLSTAINGLYIGQILGYTDLDANPNDAVHDWDKAGAAPSGVLSVMVDFTIEDMSDDDFASNLQTKIQGLKISDVITIDPSNTILSLIADSSIANLSTTINGLYVGEIMGYTPVYTGTPETLTGWKKGGEAVTGIGAIIADYTIASFSNANFASTLITDIKNELKISEFMPAGSNPIFNLFDNYNQLTVVEFEAQMQTRFTAANFTLGDMVTLGIIEQATVTSNGLWFDAIRLEYNTSNEPEDPDIDHINKLPIKVVFDALFDLIPAIP